MTNHYTKELDTKNQKKSKKYAEELDKISAEIRTLKQKKEEAMARIPAIEKELTQLVTDVDVITDDKKRKEVLKHKRELQDELDELELFANMNIETYKINKVDELHSLGEEAAKEYREYDKKITALHQQAKEELKEKKSELFKARGNHIFKRCDRSYSESLNRKRAKEFEKEREQKRLEKEKAQVIHVDADGSPII